MRARRLFTECQSVPSRGALYIGRLYRRESRAPHSPAVSAARTARSWFFPH